MGRRLSKKEFMDRNAENIDKESLYYSKKKKSPITIIS